MLGILSVPSVAQTNNGLVLEKDADLVRFPKIKHNPDLSKVGGLVPGDTIPDYLWDLPLWVVNHPEGKDTITLREYEHSKLLVLDLWTTWCAPCIKSVEKWIDIQRHYPGEIDVVTIHMDFDYKALPFVQHRGWKYPVVIGEGRVLVSRHFFTQQTPGGVVLIKDGKVFSIPSWRSYDAGIIGDILAGNIKNFPSVTDVTHYGNLIKQDTIN
ncbi:hypothetical protein GCM10011386_11370 [Parapedobacter defluvii]|uniref:Thioredoxin domain-containing protein n=2 Tax=Parapedobacter defluvii TaxID=2045106 RepID=A0ABQ1L8Y2_9SPHI|nr:hypothetical protein GCM10011386_11370 [Parapedobacter defluvii]